MRSAIRLGFEILLLLAASCGDAGGHDTPPPPMHGIGEACTSAADCSSMSCAGAGVCTKKCTTHTDCGCPSGTTNGDIVNGRCDVGCFDMACSRVCHSNLDCAGRTTCVNGDAFDACE
jgi:hypothetical protein